MKFCYLSNTKPTQSYTFMKILKYLLFLILLIFIGTAIYFGTKESSYEIKDALIIQAPPQVVFNKVNNLKSWDQWKVWKQKEPNIVFNHAEQNSGEGASFSWDAKQSGSVITTKVIPNKEIHQDVAVKTGRGEVNSKMDWQFDEVDGNTYVSFILKGEHSLFDKVYYSISGTDFNTDLHLIKQAILRDISKEVVEDMKRYSIHVDGVTQYGGGYYMYVTSAAKQDQVRERMGSMMGEVRRFISRNNLSDAGNPFLLFNEINPSNNTVIFSTCFPVREKVITPQSSPVLCDFMEPVTAVKTSLKGNYNHFAEAYDEARKYMDKNGYQQDPQQKVFEVYVTNPDSVVNPAEWLTEIYIPIISTPEPVLEYNDI